MKDDIATIYTIGYSDKTLTDFIRCLKKRGIDSIVDVRTIPKSKRFPDYNKESIEKFLRKNQIFYFDFGKYFGARRNEKNVYDLTYSLKGDVQEQVIFEKVQNLDIFKEGVQRIEKGLNNGNKICFMCSEKNPVNCHRFWMVAMYFYCSLSIPIVNIIDVNDDETIDETISHLNYEEEKRKFYSVNSSEINGSLMLGLEPIKWIDWWNRFFSLDNSNILKAKITFANTKIGYIKNERCDD